MDVPFGLDFEACIALDSSREAACRAFTGPTATIQYCSELNVYPDMPCWFMLRETTDSGALVGLVSLFAPLATELEISAWIAPAWRRRGLFSFLLAQARAVLHGYGYQRILLVADRREGSGGAVLAHWACTLDHSEYAMELEREYSTLDPENHLSLALRRAGVEDLPALVAIQARAFEDSEEASAELMRAFLAEPQRQVWLGEIHGHVVAAGALYDDGQSWSINAVAVEPSRQGQGLGRSLLSGLVRRCPPAARVVLDVDTANPAALKLYRSIGFVEQRVLDYFSLNQAMDSCM